jgi:serine/threonine protein kinase
LKPENLFFAQEPDGRTRIKVLDFGMARLLDQQAITTYGMALGTPSFMAPEQAAGRLNEIDGRTDLFALAATGFRLRVGRRIHEADNPVELVQAMAREPAPPIRSIAPQVSAPYARVIDKALQFRREDRYESAAAMQADVKRAIAELSGAPEPQGTPLELQRTVELSAGDLEPVPVYGLDESIRIPKRRGALMWLALIAIVGAGGALLVRSRWSAGGTVPTASAASSSSSALTDAGTPMDAGTARPRGPTPKRPASPSGRGGSREVP